MTVDRHRASARRRSPPRPTPGPSVLDGWP